MSDTPADLFRDLLAVLVREGQAPAWKWALFALVVGLLFGGVTLIVEIEPPATFVEGFAGGVLGCAVLFAGLRYMARLFPDIPRPE